jgi:hypothetical protein
VVASLAFLVVAVVAVVGALLYPERLAFWRGGASEGASSAEESPGVATTGEPAPSGEATSDGAEREAGDARELMTAVARLEERLVRVESHLEDLAGASSSSWREEVGGRLEGLESDVAALDGSMRSLLGRIGDEMAGLREGLADVGDRLEGLGTREPVGSTATAPAIESSDAPVTDRSDATPPGEKPDSSNARILRDLESPEAGKRFSALVELGRLGRSEHVPIISEVLLTDEDLVVRELAANILGNLGDASAIEPLVRSLRDPAVSVVMAADDALQRITKRSSGMKRRLGTEARLEVVRKWEEWWERNRDSAR